MENSLSSIFQKGISVDNNVNKVLWKHLPDKPVTEFEHYFQGGSCNKCSWWYGQKGRIHCPHPDPYPGSPADIAEEIRKWMEKADIELGSSYCNELIQILKISNPQLAIIEMALHATPTDKINAFIKVMEG